MRRTSRQNEIKIAPSLVKSSPGLLSWLAPLVCSPVCFSWGVLLGSASGLLSWAASWVDFFGAPDTLVLPPANCWRFDNSYTTNSGRSESFWRWLWHKQNYALPILIGFNSKIGEPGSRTPFDKPSEELSGAGIHTCGSASAGEIENQAFLTYLGLWGGSRCGAFVLCRGG